MRKITYVLTILSLLLLTACSSEEKATSSKGEDKTEKNEAVEVDKGLLNIEITLPASMFEGEDLDTVISNAEEKGAEVTKNEDGSLTYKMSKSEHKKMMKEIETDIIKSLEEMKNDEEWVSIKDIIHNKTFSEFTLVVDKEAYENSMDGFAAIGLGMSGMIYQIYNGVSNEDSKVTISLKDQSTEEVFDQIIYPEDLSEEE